MLHISKIKNSKSFYEIKDMYGDSAIITGFVEAPVSLNDETKKRVKCEGQYGITFTNKVTEKTVDYENITLDKWELIDLCKWITDPDYHPRQTKCGWHYEFFLCYCKYHLLRLDKQSNTISLYIYSNGKDPKHIIKEVIFRSNEVEPWRQLLKYLEELGN